MSKEVTFSHPYTQLLIAARAASIPVIYVTVAFRPGYPEISPRNQIFAAVKQRQSPSSAPMTTMEIHPAIAPQPTDIVVTKRRVSAFSGSVKSQLFRTPSGNYFCRFLNGDLRCFLLKLSVVVGLG